MKIQSRTFIVSGGSSGLGLATVQLLLASNAYVSILDRDPPPSSISSSTRLKFTKADITDLPALYAFVTDTVAWAANSKAPLAGVINCAGVASVAKIIDAQNKPHDLDIWNLVLAVNLTGSFNLTRLVLEHLIRVDPEGEDAERGVVVFVSSAAAFEGQPGQTAYAATKGALRSMTLPMARDLARFGVRVVSIAPGVFESPMTVHLPEKARRSLTEQGVVYPRRFGRSEEFAETVRWVLECAYVNGETVRLSGAGRLPGKL